MSITSFNKQSVFFSFKETNGFDYKSLEDAYLEGGKNETHVVRGLYINSGKFGEQPLAVTNTCFINLPTHLVDDVKSIINDKRLVDDINNKVVGFEIYEYTNKKYNRKCYAINWISISNTDGNQPETDSEVPF